MALPDGYQTVIGEGGASPSGGEKQRISIARAIMKDAPVIILDEATANVDPESEAELTAAIEELTKEKTIIMIAHRLRTVRHADQIFVVDNGKIVQHGTHNSAGSSGAFSINVTTILMIVVLAAIYFGSRKVLKKGITPIGLIGISALVGMVVYGL